MGGESDSEGGGTRARQVQKKGGNESEWRTVYCQQTGVGWARTGEDIGGLRWSEVGGGGWECRGQIKKTSSKPQ